MQITISKWTFRNNLPSIFASLVLIGILLPGCKKEKFAIEGVTGYQWKVYMVQETSDGFINPIPTDWQLNLNDDQTFSFKISGTTCGGTYTWKAIDAERATVKFNISNWNMPAQSPAMADKLKKIVQTADNSFMDPAPFLGVYPSPPGSATVVLQFQGNNGYFYVYR